LELEHRRSLVLRVAEVEGDRQPLQLRLARGPRSAGGELHDPPAPTFGLRVALEPVRADVDDPADADTLAHVAARPAADDADERVPLYEPLELRSRLRGWVRILRPRHDRREHAVEVEEDAGLGR